MLIEQHGRPSSSSPTRGARDLVNTVDVGPHVSARVRQPEPHVAPAPPPPLEASEAARLREELAKTRREHEIEMRVKEAALQSLSQQRAPTRRPRSVRGATEEPASPDTAADSEDDGRAWVVTLIKGRRRVKTGRGNGTRLEYLCSFKQDCGVDYADEWLPAKDLSCPRVIAAFEARRQAELESRRTQNRGSSAATSSGSDTAARRTTTSAASRRAAASAAQQRAAQHTDSAAVGANEGESDSAANNDAVPNDMPPPPPPRRRASAAMPVPHGALPQRPSAARASAARASSGGTGRASAASTAATGNPAPPPPPPGPPASPSPTTPDTEAQWHELVSQQLHVELPVSARAARDRGVINTIADAFRGGPEDYQDLCRLRQCVMPLDTPERPSSASIETIVGDILRRLASGPSA